MNDNEIIGHKTVRIIVYIMLSLIMLLFVSGTLNSCVVHHKVINMVSTCTDSMKLNNHTINKCIYENREIPVSIVEKYTSDIREFASECYFLLDSNAVTYMVTLIVALLAALLLNRIEKIESLVIRNEQLVTKNEELIKQNKNIKNEVAKYISQSTICNMVIIRIESVYDISIMIDNITDMVNFQGSNNFLKVGELCSRIHITTDELFESINKNKFMFLSETERQIMFTYIDDSLGLLERAGKSIKGKSIISEIVGNRYNDIDALKSRLQQIEVKM